MRRGFLKNEASGTFRGAHVDEGEYASGINNRWLNGVFHPGLGEELLTTYGHPKNPPQALSRITIGVLEDIGYTVNYDAAEDYDPKRIPTIENAYSIEEKIKRAYQGWQFGMRIQSNYYNFNRNEDELEGMFIPANPLRPELDSSGNETGNRINKDGEVVSEWKPMEISAISIWFCPFNDIKTGDKYMTLLQVNRKEPNQFIGIRLGGSTVEEGESDIEKDSIGHLISVHTDSGTISWPNSPYEEGKTIDTDYSTPVAYKIRQLTETPPPPPLYPDSWDKEDKWHHLVINHNGHNYDIWLDGVNVSKKDYNEAVQMGEIVPWHQGAEYPWGSHVLHNKVPYIAVQANGWPGEDQEPSEDSIYWQPLIPKQEVMVSAEEMSVAFDSIKEEGDYWNPSIDMVNLHEIPKIYPFSEHKWKELDNAYTHSYKGKIQGLTMWSTPLGENEIKAIYNGWSRRLNDPKRNFPVVDVKYNNSNGSNYHNAANLIGHWTMGDGTEGRKPHSMPTAVMAEYTDLVTDYSKNHNDARLVYHSEYAPDLQAATFGDILGYWKGAIGDRPAIDVAEWPWRIESDPTIDRQW